MTLNLKLFKIGLYARVSSKKQAQEKTINSQIASIVEYTNSLEEKIDPDLHFIDDGVSGASLERPGLDRLRDKALAGEVTKVYILSPDRLSRKSAHQVLLIEEMRRLGVTFAFVNRQIGDTPEDQMLLQIQGVVAEYEREKIMERSRRGKLYAARNGKVNVLGGAPYGYYYQKATESKDANYLIHPEEAPIVKEAFLLYCNKNFSIGEIAKHFTNKSYLTRSGKTFWERSVIWGSMGLFLIDDGKFDKVDSARTRLWQEIMGEKLVRAEAHIQEKQPKLVHDEVCAIAKDLIYHNYEREVAKLIKDNPVVAELGKTRPLAAKYLAKNLVDFRNNYGEDLLTESRVKMMEEVSIAQSNLHKNIDHKMQEFDDKILSGKHKSLSSKILDANILAGDREMTAKSFTSQAEEVLSYRLMLRGDSYYEKLHDHHEYRHDLKTDHDNYHAPEHEYRHDITEQIRQARSMQHEYHQEMERQQAREININHDIGIT